MLYTVTGRAIVPAERADVVWVYRRARRQWLAEWLRGERGGEFFYSMVTLGDRYHVGFVEDESANPFMRAWYPVEALVARRIGMGFALDVAVRNLRALNRARVVVSTVDSCGLPLALLKRVGVLRPRLVYISQGLSDRVATYGPARRLARGYRRLLRAADALVTLSAGAGDALARWLGVARDRVRVLPFGTDCDFWTPPASAEIGDRIVSVGSDAGRDYQTLLEAADGCPLHIVTRQTLASEPPTLLHTTEHSERELRDLYARARFVVIPLHDRDQPSGQSAALQAMACGKATVITRTRGWWGDPILRDGEACVLVPPGDVKALRVAIETLASDPERCRRLGRRAREAVVAHFSERTMAAALGAVIDGELAC